MQHFFKRITLHVVYGKCKIKKMQTKNGWIFNGFSRCRLCCWTFEIDTFYGYTSECVKEMPTCLSVKYGNEFSLLKWNEISVLYSFPKRTTTWKQNKFPGSTFATVVIIGKFYTISGSFSEERTLQYENLVQSSTWSENNPCPTTLSNDVTGIYTKELPIHIATEWTFKKLKIPVVIVLCSWISVLSQKTLS